MLSPYPLDTNKGGAPFPGPVKGLFCLFTEGRIPSQPFSFPCPPPHCHGAGIGPHVCGWKLLGAVAGKEMESWRWNSAAGLSPYLAVKGFPDPRGQGQPVSLSPSPMSFSSTPTNVPELPWQGWADPCGPN